MFLVVVVGCVVLQCGEINEPDVFSRCVYKPRSIVLCVPPNILGDEFRTGVGYFT